MRRENFALKSEAIAPKTAEYFRGEGSSLPHLVDIGETLTVCCCSWANCTTGRCGLWKSVRREI